MYVSGRSVPFKLSCPRCRKDTLAGDIFADMDWLHVRPGVATCSACQARFSYNLVGFRIFFAGLSTFVVLSLFALATSGGPPSNHPLAMPFACLLSVLIGAFALPLAGLELVD